MGVVTKFQLRTGHHRVVLATHCTGQMMRCPMMDMHRLPARVSPEEKHEICKICMKQFDVAQKRYGFGTIELADMVDEQSLEVIERLVNTSEDNLKNICFESFPVGKMSEYDFILNTKYLVYPNLSDEHKLLYASYIKNTALSISITNNICKSYDPSLFLTFNEYAQCQGVRHAAVVNSVRRMALAYPTHYGFDCSRLSMWHSTCEYWRYTHCQQWYKYKDIPVTAKNVAECWSDALFRTYSSSSHIFSSRKTGDPQEIFKALNLKHSRKTIVVYTSSQDERTSTDIAIKIWKEDPNLLDAFPNQIAWLNFLRDYAAQHDDIQIVVRIHPREGCLSGDNSQNLEKLRATFSENTAGFIILWPDNPISSYDLMELANICLIQWSLMGQEAVRVGIPVLACTGNMFYPDDDFIQVATNAKEYKQKLDSMLSLEFTWKHLVKAVRFYHWRHFITSLDLGETVSKTFHDNSVWPSAPSSLIAVINDILRGKCDLVEYNIEQWNESLPADATIREAKAMQLGIRRFLDKIFYPPPPPPPPPPPQLKTGILFRIINRLWRGMTGKNLNRHCKMEPSFIDYRLEYSSDISRLNEFSELCKKDSALRVLVADGSNAVLVHNGKTVRRMSPMAIHLARLHDEAERMF